MKTTTVVVAIAALCAFLATAAHAQSGDAKRNVITSIEDSDVAVAVAGDVAVVRCRSLYGVMTTGTFVRADLRLLMIWQKRGGEWRLLARQAFKPA